MNVLLDTTMTQTELAKRLTRDYGESRAGEILIILLSIHRNDFGKAEITPAELALVEKALNETLAALCPEPCAGIRPEFWDTPAGQIIAQTQFWLWGDEYVSKIEAARMIYSDVTNRQLLNNIQHLLDDGKLHAYRRPNREMTRRSKYKRTGAENAPARAWMLRRSEVEKFIEERNKQN